METLALCQNETVTVFLRSEKVLSQGPGYPQFPVCSPQIFFFNVSYLQLLASVRRTIPALAQNCVMRVIRSLLHYLLEKEMAAHSSILAWKILLAEEPGRLRSKGPQRVGRD